MCKYLITFLLFLIVSPFTLQAQKRVSVSDQGWRLWLDKQAEWENDTIYLPDEVNLSKLPLNAPTGGWEILNAKEGLSVSLPTTVEEHFWGANGFRNYKNEYTFEHEDPQVKNGNYIGVSWWWKDIDVPQDFKDKEVILFIRGARLRAEVYWNRQLVGYHIINETSFTCNISKAIRPGAKNQLAIRITNPGGYMDWKDYWTMKWGKTSQEFHQSHGFGGLDRGIEITAHDPVYFTDLWALNTPQLKTIKANAKILNSSNQSSTGKIRWEIVDPNAKNRICASKEEEVEIGSGSLKHVQTELTFPEAELWSNNQPRLYRLRATWQSSGSKTGTVPSNKWNDTRDVQFGFRWFEAADIGKDATLRLNGDRVRLVSAISWGFWGRNGLWPSLELAEREVRVAKELGLNTLQFHRNIGKTDVLDYQDKLGLMRFMEPGGGILAIGKKFKLSAPSPKGPIDTSGKNGDAETFSEKYMEEKIIRMVRDHRSHPSLVMYCIQNETYPDLNNPRIFRVIRRVNEEDPSRIVVLKSGFPRGSPRNQVWMQPYSSEVLHDDGTGYSGWWDDHTVGGPGVWRDEMYKSKDDFTHRSTNKKEIIVWGEMLGSAIADNHTAMVRELKKTGGKSYDLKDHEEILEAYERFLKRWNFNSAFPTAEDLFKSLGDKSYDFWGRVIETSRLSEENDFLVISGWESTAIENHSGLVDNLRGYKGRPELVSSRLAAVRPVIKPRSLVVNRGQTALLDIYLLNESNRPHGKQMRVWMRSPKGEREELGIFDIPTFEKDRFVYPVKMELPTKPFTVEGKISLIAEVVGENRTSGEEVLLVVDVAGAGVLPKTIGMVSSHPSLRKAMEVVPGVTLEPYQSGKQYPLIVIADQLVTTAQKVELRDIDIQKTEEDQLYTSMTVEGPDLLEYLFKDLPNGEAEVTLRFAEIVLNAEGERVFDIVINGKTVAKDFDIFKAAGGKNIAHDLKFTVPITDGSLRLSFPSSTQARPAINSFKIKAGDKIVAIKTGERTFKDKDGVVWEAYVPIAKIDPQLIETIKQGTPLLVLTEGQATTTQYAELLSKAGAFQLVGAVGGSRQSWMGSWYFVRKHPLYEGLPVDCAMDSYYQVTFQNAAGLMVDGKDVEVVVGYSRDHDRNIGAGTFVSKLGKGRMVFHCLPGIVTGLYGDPAAGIQPIILRRLLANSIRYLSN
jgi:beta-galactosidase